MHFRFSFLIFAGITIFFLTFCKEDEAIDDESDNLSSAEIVVYDANSWSSSDDPLEVVSGAEISLFHDEQSFSMGNPDYSAVTDNDGKGIIMIPTPLDIDGDGIFDENTPHFLLLVEKEGRDNLKNGYAIAGVFYCSSSLDEIDQSGASVGDIRYSDINGDGVIDQDDKTSFGYISLGLANSNDDPIIENDPEEGEGSCSNQPSGRNVVFIGE